MRNERAQRWAFCEVSSASASHSRAHRLHTRTQRRCTIAPCDCFRLRAHTQCVSQGQRRLTSSASGSLGRQL